MPFVSLFFHVQVVLQSTDLRDLGQWSVQSLIHGAYGEFHNLHDWRTLGCRWIYPWRFCWQVLHPSTTELPSMVAYHKRPNKHNQEQSGQDGTRTSSSNRPSSIEATLLLHPSATKLPTKKVMFTLKFGINEELQFLNAQGWNVLDPKTQASIKFSRRAHFAPLNSS